MFCLSETWLIGSVSNDAFCVPGYYPLVRLDRSHGRCGSGVAQMRKFRFSRTLRQAFCLLSLMISSVRLVVFIYLNNV